MVLAKEHKPLQHDLYHVAQLVWGETIPSNAIINLRRERAPRLRNVKAPLSCNGIGQSSVHVEGQKPASKMLFADTGYWSTVHVAALIYELLGQGIRPVLVIIRSYPFLQNSGPGHHRSLLSPFSGPARRPSCTLRSEIGILS
jgi:hypothetical protein